MKFLYVIYVLLFIIMISNDIFLQQFSGTGNNSLGHVLNMVASDEDEEIDIFQNSISISTLF